MPCDLSVKIELLKATGKGKDELYFIENTERDKLPEAVVLFTILDNSNYGNSICLNALEFELNSPSSIFGINRSGLMNKISVIIDEFKDITFTDQAGIKELQFKKNQTLKNIRHILWQIISQHR